MSPCTTFLLLINPLLSLIMNIFETLIFEDFLSYAVRINLWHGIYHSIALYGPKNNNFFPFD